MPARTPGNEISHRRSESPQMEQTQARVIGNERLTALVSFVLLVLILVELVTSAVLRSWLPPHTFVGVALAGPLLVKMGSTGWRFLRYYTRAPAYVCRGPLPVVFARPWLGPARHHAGDDGQWDWACRDRPDPAVSSRACVQRAGLAAAAGCP
jgi:hypothetical protein